MTLGYDGSLYILAFDHRGSFQKKFFGIAGDPTPEETARISDAKTVIYEGLLRAIGWTIVRLRGPKIRRNHPPDARA